MGYSPNPSGASTTPALLGTSPAMRKVAEAVARGAAHGLPVLVCGEPGSGREMVARAIHERRWGRNAPFVKLDCSHSADAAIDLFGVPSHDGRRNDRRLPEPITRQCRLYESLGGTAYVENLWRLPHRLQVRLVRLLHDGEAIIADDHERVEFDTQLVVVVDTSTREDGRLESELWQPLLKNRIDLPPLRERREDIPALTAFFVEESCRRANLPVKALSQPARELLGALPWYGNAGELKMLVDGLVARVRSTTITLADILANVQLEGRVRPFMTLRTLRDARARFEREYITVEGGRG